MDNYQQLLSRLKALNPGTKSVIHQIFNPRKCALMATMVSHLKRINELEPAMQALSAEQMKEKTVEFRKRLSEGETLDDLLVEAFALVREAAKRQIGLRHFDVQIIGGITLHNGMVGEMSTGEGKTLVATLPLYLNALSQQGCHLVTVNDYLAKRDTQWMGPIFYSLGLSIGCIISHKDLSDPYTNVAYVYDPSHLPADSRLLCLRSIPRKDAYLCDITYGVGSEFGFDYLRDNMARRPEDTVQRPLNFAIIDEVDSILIDEARTPLIISGASDESTKRYYEIDRLVRKLNRTSDFTVDEESQIVALSDEGLRKCERFLSIPNLYDGVHTEEVHHINQALRAHVFFRRDKEYVVKNGQVIIVDDFTGRLMPGRRWSDGLHQAVEAKEGVVIESENQTLATVSFQNYFRLYNKISGMTGTALTEAPEFKEIYKLDVVAVPTNSPLQRKELDDEIYKTEKEKFQAIATEIEEVHATGRPVLVGTISIEKAEKLSRLLRHKNLPHQVLHGKNHEAEATIIAQAGKTRAITIATQMAGRGVDIILGGNPEILAREETIRSIWEQRALSGQKKRETRDFHELIANAEDSYKKKIEELDKKYLGTIDSLKKDLLEKEEFFSSLDLSTKEALERKVLLLRGGEEFEKQEGRIIKQRERYEEALRHYNASLREHENAPDKAKEEREALNRAWKDLEALKASIRRRFGIILKPDIDEARARFIQACEAFQRKESSLRETLGFGEELSESLEHAETLIAETLSASLKKEKVFLDFSSALNDFKETLHSFLSASSAADENDLLHQVSEFIKREQSSGVALDTAFERLERAELVEEAGDALLAAEKAYKKSLEAHEKALSLYERELSEAREAHEALRSSYEEQWKKAREEMEKSPEEFRAVNETLLQKFSLPWQTEHEKVIETGGLHVIGSERFEARRIDNQLKGRSGRQGDPGSSKFYLSLEDDLLRIFGSERLMGIMGTMPEGENITHPLLTKMITNAQKKVEGRNFEIRKQLLDFDDVLNQQRKVIYGIRQDVLNKKNLQEILEEFAEGFLSKTEEEFLPEQVPEKWALDPLSLQIETVLQYKPDIPSAEEIRTPRDWKEDFKETLLQWISSQIQEQFRSFKEIFPEVVKIILLQAIDHRWKSHLRAIDDLREGIGLRAYAQKDVVVAYKQEAFMMFEEMLAAIQKEALSGVFHIKIEETLPVEQSSRTTAPISFLHQAPEQFSQSPQDKEGIQAPSESRSDPTLPPPRIQPVRTGKKVGRNEPCPCGSGKKYKHCCGKG